MNELFASMKEQMNPSLQVRAELRAALSRPVKAKRSINWTAMAAAAACLTLALCALPQLNARAPKHSFTTTDQPFSSMETQKRPVDGDSGTGSPGAMPGGAYFGDVPVQQGAEAYLLLQAALGVELPDWYGGAYVDATGHLTVLLVESQDPGDKSLELQVLEWTNNASVAFSSAKYSLAHLNGLMASLNGVMDGYDGPSTWGLNEVANRIDLDVPTPLSDALLEELAKLDPDDDAISVRVYEGSVLDLQQKGPAPTEQPVPVVIGDDVDGDPSGYHHDTQPAELPIPEPVDGTEIPHYDILPAPVEDLSGQTADTEQGQPAHYDLLPLD